jgi:hypothetical protein
MPSTPILFYCLALSRIVPKVGVVFIATMSCGTSVHVRDGVETMRAVSCQIFLKRSVNIMVGFSLCFYYEYSLKLLLSLIFESKVMYDYSSYLKY